MIKQEGNIIMNLLYILIPVVITIALAIPFFFAHKNGKNPEKAKKSMIINLCSFFAVIAVCLALPIGTTVFAADNGGSNDVISTVNENNTSDNTVTSDVTTTADQGISKGLGYIGAALATGFACIGAGLAVAAAAPAAIGAVSEDPKSFGKAIIFVVLGEGVAIYGLLISILIINNL